MNVVVAGLGTMPLAALMAVLQVNSVAFMPAFGIASAGAILVGQAIGAGRKHEVPGLVALAFGMAGGWQSLVGLAYLSAPDLVLAGFARDPASARELVEVGRRMLLLSVGWQLFDAAASVLAESLRAAGDTAFTLWARLAIAWAVFAPGAGSRSACSAAATRSRSRGSSCISRSSRSCSCCASGRGPGGGSSSSSRRRWPRRRADGASPRQGAGCGVT
jgi:hypothetical protein